MHRTVLARSRVFTSILTRICARFYEPCVRHLKRIIGAKVTTPQGTEARARSCAEISTGAGAGAGREAEGGEAGVEAGVGAGGEAGGEAGVGAGAGAAGAEKQGAIDREEKEAEAGAEVSKESRRPKEQEQELGSKAAVGK